MYSPKQTLICTFTAYLEETYQAVFGQIPYSYINFLGTNARLVLERIAQSDALYHDLEHTILVTSVGQEILQAKRLCEGHASVTAKEWLHFMMALLCHDIGYCKGVCNQDDAGQGRYTLGVEGGFVSLPYGATDAFLSPYHVDRSMQFLQEQFQDEPLVDVATVQRIVERTRFPARDNASVPEIRGLADLGRAADLIGQFSDRNYLQKLPALFYEFEQNGTNKILGYQQLTDVHAGLSEFYWQQVHGYVRDAIAYLQHTATGQQIVTELYANVSAPAAKLCA